MSNSSNSPRFDLPFGFAGLLPAAFAVLALGFAGQEVADLLAWQRQAIASGEWWRLLTAHWVHLNLPHTFMNFLALVLVVGLFRDHVNAAEWLVVFLLIAVAVSVQLYFLVPQLGRYVGASGVIHGMVAYGALRHLSSMRVESAVLLAGLVIKLSAEYWRGAADSTEALIGGRVIVEAHLFGALAGAALAVVPVLVSRRRGFRRDA